MDVVIDTSGHIKTRSGLPKLQMELLKTCLTARTTVDGKKYGSTVPRLIGEKQYLAWDNFLQGIVAASVAQTIEDYKGQQSASLPDEERILQITKGIIVRRDAADPTIIVIQAMVDTYSGDTVEVMHQLATV